MRRAIKQLKKHKACGPSGIGPMHLKYIAKEQKQFLERIVDLFNQLIEFPDYVEHLPNLYKFRAIFIPKPNSDKFRPISISETMLLLFHKLLTAKLRD